MLVLSGLFIETHAEYPHLLRNLILVERQSTSTALHDDRRAQAAENACLVVFGRIELCSDSIIGVRELGIACGTYTDAVCRSRKTKSIGAWYAEDVAVKLD